MSDAQMSMARVLRPFWRFEYYYGRVGASSSISGAVPIRLFPVNPNVPAQTDSNPPSVDQFAFDEGSRAGLTGYSPALTAMLPVSSIGSMLLAYVPQIPYIGIGGGQLTPFMYAFVPVWRMRTIADWKRFKKQGNIPFESFGAKDSYPPSSQQERYILPASRGSAIYMQPEPSTDTGTPASLGFQMAYPEGVATVTGPDTYWYGPIVPTADGKGLMGASQQGIVDRLIGLFAGTQPFYRPFWSKVMGNELCFDVYKLEVPTAGSTEWTFRDWDFQYNDTGTTLGYCSGPGEDVVVGEDLAFSCIFGVGAEPTLNPKYTGMHAKSGVYVFTGTSG